jgi:desulfoferrodoxin (superoxide reductase-like protein)
VWIYASSKPEPENEPRLRDDQGRVWVARGGQWHTEDGRHHLDWSELHRHTDLVEEME